jgi:hypothetical protein
VTRTLNDLSTRKAVAKTHSWASARAYPKNEKVFLRTEKAKRSAIFVRATMFLSPLAALIG